MNRVEGMAVGSKPGDGDKLQQVRQSIDMQMSQILQDVKHPEDEE